MGKFLKGQDAKFLVQGNPSTTLLEKETSCSLSFNVNTVDASSKSDANPEYENAEFDNVELSASVEGNVKDAAEVKSLLKTAIGTATQTYLINATLGTHSSEESSGVVANTITLGANGGAVITSLEVDMPAEGLATVNLSVECGSDFTIE